MQNYKTYQFVLILAPFVFSFAFGLDIYIPVVPQMTEIFETTQMLVHLTLSLFLFTTGLGQLWIGPLSDRYGRKPVFYAASACYAAGALMCAAAPGIVWLIAGRFVCSLGACGMLVTSFAMVRDIYANKDSARMYSFLNGAIGISPTFAPIIGGYLALYFGWQSVFVFLAIVGVFAIVVTRVCVEETHPEEKRIRVSKAVFKRYLDIFTHPQFLVYSLIAGLAEGIFFCFFSISPFIIIGLLGVPTHYFGYYFAVFGAVIALGGLGSGKVIEKAGIPTTVAIGIACMIMGGICMLAWYYLATLSLAGFLIPMVLACTGAIFVVGAAASAALEPFAALAGTASAGFGAATFSLSSLMGGLLMLFPVASTVPYGIVITLAGLLSWLVFRMNEKRSSNSTTEFKEVLRE